ncbi:ABC transporter permease [Corticibacter populi]|nr:ABC transporter permease [Corticibacter populi]
MIATAVIFIAWLAANFSARQPATVALDVGLSGIRLVLMLMALFWVQELLGKDIERKSLYFVLAYPVSRGVYLASRFFAVAALLALGVLVLGLALGAVLGVLPVSYSQPTPIHLGGAYALVLLGIWLDLLVIAAFALLLCSLSTTPFLPLILGCFFALAARSLGVSLQYLLAPGAEGTAEATYLLPVLNVAQWLLPDLSRLDWRDLSLYGLPVPWAALGWAALMALGYCGLLLALATWKFKRREFI